MAGPLASSQGNVSVYNAALAELGVEPITSFLDDSLAARTGNLLYMNTLESALADYPWRFARDRQPMVQLDDETPPPWQSSWALPDTALAVNAVYDNGMPTSFDRFVGRIVTNIAPSTTIVPWAEITISVAPDRWGSHFRLGFIFMVAAVVCMPITQDASLAQAMQQLSGVLIARAKSHDAQGRTSSKLDTKMFIRQRRAGR